MRPSLCALAIWLSVISVAPALGAPASTQAREIEARKAFARGSYEAAASIFADLYGETLHPNYLRNIGRCYQNLDRPDEAIKSFREYLRQQKNITSKERVEIEGFIKELEALKLEATSPTTQAPARNVPAASVLPPPPLPNASPPPVSVVLVQRPASTPVAEGHSPIYKRWWFWTALGGAAVAGTIGILAGRAAAGDTPGCPADFKSCVQAGGAQ